MREIKTRTVPLLGVDIGSSAVKLIQLAQAGRGGGYQVRHHALEPLPRGAVVEKRIIEVEAVGLAIQRALARSGSKARQAATAVATAAVMTKIIPMPAGLDQDQLESQIELDAAQHIPYPIEEVCLDFEVLGPVPQHPSQAQILLAAARAENVEICASALELGGLNATVVDAETLVIENAFTLLDGICDGQRQTGLIAVVDIGAVVTTLTLLRDGHSLYSREQVFGGHQLIEEVMRRYALDEAQAALAMRQDGLSQDYRSAVLAPFVDALIQQISRLLQFFYASTEFTRVDRVVLAGGCAMIRGVADSVARSLAIPTVVADPFAQMHQVSQSQVQPADGPAWLLACGLALRGFD